MSILPIAALTALLVSMPSLNGMAHAQTRQEQKPSTPTLFTVLKSASEKSGSGFSNQSAVEFSKRITDLLGIDLESGIDTGYLGGDWNTSIIRGEWETAGGMEIPYVPRYRYRYVCQAELSDGQWHPDANSSNQYPDSYKIIGVTRFEVDSKRLWINDFKQLPWVWVKYRRDSQELIDRPKNAPSLKGHSVSFWIQRGQGGVDTDLARLHLTVSLPVGGYLIPRSTTSEVERTRTYLSGTAEIEGQKPSKSQGQWGEVIGRRLFVECFKKQ